jgi:hypothetical protein
MRISLPALILALCLGSCPVLGNLYLQGDGVDHAQSFSHDRFYTGADKAFIGAAFDWSGVGGAVSTGTTAPSTGPWATMISPSYFVSAIHYGP